MMANRERARVAWPMGTFVLDLPEAWGVLQDGAADGLVVLDPLPGRPINDELVVRANVLLRHYAVEAGRGLGVEAWREARAGLDANPGSVLVDYGYGHSDAGVQYRRLHAVLPVQGHAVQSVRWLFGDGEAVLELVVTFEDDQVGDELWETGARLAASVRLDSRLRSHGGELGGGVPRDSLAALVAPVSGQALEDVEALGEGRQRPAPSEVPGVTWEELSLQARAVVEDFPPFLLAEGIRDGRTMRFAAYRDRMSAVMVVSTQWGAGESAEMVEEYIELSSLLVPLEMLVRMGFFGGWWRAVDASVAVDSVRPEWEVEVGGERSLALLARLDEGWLVTDGHGSVVAEWRSSPDGAVAVFRHERDGRVQVTGVDGFSLYTRMLTSWVAGHAV